MTIDNNATGCTCVGKHDGGCAYADPTYHATVYHNDHRVGRMVNSVGTELTKQQAERIVRDLNTALSLLGCNAYAELTEEDN